MTKRIFLLNGLAIITLILNHAASVGYCAMFFWADQYRPVSVPNYDQVGSLPYYALLLPHQLTLFTVPAFLFVSGFFVAYMSRGSQPSPSWRMVRMRIVKLLIPYLIWSTVVFCGDALQGILYTPIEYIARLLTGEVYPGYYFAPLLCELYLLAPLLVPVARTHWRRLLAVSAVLTWGLGNVTYLRIFCPTLAPALEIVRHVMPVWLNVRLFFFFAFGLVAGLHLEPFKQWLARYRWQVLAAMIILGCLTIVEPEILYRRTGDWNLRSNCLLLSSSLYAVACILCFLAFDWIPASVSGFVRLLAAKTYGIYLTHGLVMEFVARAIRKTAPWLLADQWLLQPILIVAGLGVPLLAMTLVSRLPMRRAYEYLFG